MTPTRLRAIASTLLIAALACLLVVPLCGCSGPGTGTGGPASGGSADATGAAPAPLAPAKTGDRVAAPWGGDMYVGSVQAVRGDTADVLYDDDQIVREVAISDLLVITVREWKVGDPVNAVWTTGRFYPGVITAVKDGGIYTVQWDDGDAPSDVDAGMIYAGEAEE